MPVGAASFSEALRWGVETYHALKALLHDAGCRRPSATRAGSRRTSGRTRRPCSCSSRPSRRAGYTPGDDIAIALDPATSEFFDTGRRATSWRARAAASSPADMAGVLRRPGATATRSCRSRTAWPRRTGTAGPRSPRRSAGGSSSSATTCSSPTSSGSPEGIDWRRRQLDPRQGQPDRHADRDARHRRPRDVGGLHRGDVAPLGRDRGHDHRRPRGGHQLRPDQDRRAGPFATGWPSTTSCCASRRCSASRPPTSGAPRSRPGERRRMTAVACARRIAAAAPAVDHARVGHGRRRAVHRRVPDAHVLGAALGGSQRAQHQLTCCRTENAKLEQQAGDAQHRQPRSRRIAREKYNLVRPGEEAYAILPPPPPKIAVPPVWPFTGLAPRRRSDTEPRQCRTRRRCRCPVTLAWVGARR